MFLILWTVTKISAFSLALASRIRVITSHSLGLTIKMCIFPSFLTFKGVNQCRALTERNVESGTRDHVVGVPSVDLHVHLGLRTIQTGGQDLPSNE